ncbi:MAG: MBL fold metallo-hydrolase [Planctomycetota bacterium]|nr:MAG: MBL fold metallo-hydrolase [Planctomycetota bacterium]
MRITFIGTGGAIPDANRAPSALLVEDGDAKMLVDCGSGTLHRLLDYGVTHRDLTYILITHFHVDHSLDIPALFQAMAVDRPREKPITLIGPLGFYEFLKNLLKSLGLLKYLHGEKVQLLEIGPDATAEVINDTDNMKRVIELGSHVLSKPPFMITAANVKHNPESTAYRIVDSTGKTLAVSGDSGPCDGLVEISKKADLFVLECSLPDDYEMEMHMTPSTAAETVERANPKKVALTHFYPVWYERDLEADIAEAFGKRDVIIAEDGMSMEI